MCLRPPPPRFLGPACSLYSSGIQDQWELFKRNAALAGIEHLVFGRKMEFNFAGDAKFRSAAHWTVISARLEGYRERLYQLREGQVVIFSDVDVQFFKGAVPALLDAASGVDLAFMADEDGETFNAGFAVVRNNARTRLFYDSLCENFDARGAHTMLYGDQTIINEYLPTRQGTSYRLGPLTWTALPADAVVGNCYEPYAVRINHQMKVHQATGCTGNSKKINALERTRAYFSAFQASGHSSFVEYAQTRLNTSVAYI